MSAEPWPECIEPDRNPGGLIVQLYDDHGALLLEQSLGYEVSVAAAAIEAAMVASRAAGDRAAIVIFAAYDGDTGQPFVPPMHFLLTPPGSDEA